MKSLIKVACILFFASISTILLAQQTQTSSISHPELLNELLKMLREDQTIRGEWAQESNPELIKRVNSVDLKNTARLREIIDDYGWPRPDMVGEDGTFAAFMILQHADHSFQKKMLPVIEIEYKAGRLEGQDYALLLDRVLVRDGKPQIYGTQAKPIEEWNGEEPIFFRIEDEENVDKRRAEIGLPPLEEYKRSLKNHRFPLNQKK